MSNTISPELLKTVRNRMITFNAGLGISLVMLAVAILVRNGSPLMGVMGLLGIVGTLIFFLLSGSENESYRRAKNGEAPYND